VRVAAVIAVGAVEALIASLKASKLHSYSRFGNPKTLKSRQRGRSVIVIGPASWSHVNASDLLWCVHSAQTHDGGDGRGSHSSTFRLNVSTFFGIGGCVEGLFTVCLVGIRGY
jgi:hypothetical protein